MFINSVRRAMRSCCGHGGAIRSAGEVRASAPIRALVAVIAALLAVQFMPVAAFAESINAQIISGPSLTPIDNMIGASIAAPDRYVAAALLMGYSPETISGWDDDIKAKLSNEQTGGSFYTFANNSVQNYYDATEHTGIFKTFLDFVGGTFWNTAETLYGNNLWAALYTPYEMESAANDLASVLAGGNIGGGGSSDYTSFTFTNDDYSIRQGYTIPSGSALAAAIRANPVMNYTITGHALDVLSQKLQEYQYCAFYGTAADRNSYGPSLGVYACLSNTAPTIDANSGTVYFPEGIRIYFSICTLSSGDYVLDSVINTKAYNSDQWSYGIYFTDNSNVTPVIPPSNWPDEPSAPSPPELPEPGTNPTVTPAPWSPVLSPTFDFDLNITTDPTSSDLIDWLQKIYYELKAFHRDAHDWANDFGGGFTKVVQAVNSASSQLYSQLLVIDSSIHDEGLRIRNYMYQMFHWLKDQLNFQNDSFNDNNIVYWLKRIWSKLGSGDINLRPTDPTTEPDDWWDWLVKAIQNFLIGLAATSTELISEIADLASQVMHEFPFSIPWDIAAVLAALSTAPITPVFTITVPAVDGWWASFDFVIDMSPFDGAAETIRLMEKLLFTGLLIWKSKDLLDFMDVTKWFN